MRLNCLVFLTVFCIYVCEALLDDEKCLSLSQHEKDILNVDLLTFDDKSGNLTIDLSRIVKVETCVEKKRLLRVELISTTTSSIKNGCYKTKKDSFVQDSATLNATSLKATFSGIAGLYYIRLASCTVLKSGHCKIPKGDETRYVCIGNKVDPKDDGNRLPLRFAPQLKNPDANETCEFRFPTNMSADAIEDNQEGFCDVNIRAVIPLCKNMQEPGNVTLTLVDVNLGDVCTFGDFEKKQREDKLSNQTLSPISLALCEKSWEKNGSNNDCGSEFSAALLNHRVNGLARNSSYCLFFRLNHPNCQGQFGCVFYTETVNCGFLEGSQQQGFLIQTVVTGPIFIGTVSLILVSSLVLLTWTVIQCSKKKHGTPLITQNQIGTAKKPPRSLTEDDLEHISRLPSQEIILVYFPDTNRFKELNRKLRSWLVTLDVNDVKDIYDEKVSEDVMKNSDQWVKNTLIGPEKRIILVCSRLAFECLTSIKSGNSSPHFVDNDPHFGLLTKTIQYLDREMRGNYRNLICVRFEDLKICSRQYSSEAFNLVPGTEYVLPQHLEDIYRWIHPRQPRPELWSDTRQEVRDLLEAIKQYKHHDDNIFTVQFSAPDIL